MKRLTTLSAVVLLVIGIALGSFGTAAAGGLTKKAVKKIAAKVVTQKAPTLSVDHATTAETADKALTLSGSTAADLRTRAITFTVPIETAYNNGQSITTPAIPAGDYIVTGSGLINTTAGSFVECVFGPDGGSRNTLIMNQHAESGHLPVVSGNGFVSLPSANTFTLICTTPASWTTIDSHPLRITFLRADSVTSLAPTP